MKNRREQGRVDIMTKIKSENDHGEGGRISRFKRAHSNQGGKERERRGTARKKEGESGREKGMKGGEWE